MPSLALPDSFEYLCYVPTTITKNVILTVRRSTLGVRSDVYRRQILTTKVDPRTIRVNYI